MTWKLLVVMVCLTAHSVGAMDVDLVAHVFSLIGVLLDLLTILGGQGSPGGATSSGRAGCNTPTETTDICGYYRNNAACPSLVGCNICTQGGGQDRINKECAAACTLFKNDRYQNGNGGRVAFCVPAFDACYCGFQT